MTVLILGCKGNLGNQLMTAYADLNPVGWGREDLDITDEQAVWDKVTALKPDLVYNCAALNDVDKAEEDRAFTDTINGYAAGYVAKACRAAGAKLVQYSTGMVFDGGNPEGYSEDDSPGPVNAYGRSKLLGEMETQENCDDLYIIRTSWLYGPHGPGRTNKKSFVKNMLEQAAAGQPISAAEDEIGRPTYTVDLAQASRALVEDEKEFGIYHTTNSGNASRLDWAREIFKLRGKAPQLVGAKGATLPRRARRLHYEVLNNTKFLEMRPWTEALKEFLNSETSQ
jgi:dTDP-4-dehydrorhamnose reductase